MLSQCLNTSRSYFSVTLWRSVNGTSNNFNIIQSTPITRTLAISNLALTRTNFPFLSGRSLYYFTLDNSNPRQLERFSISLEGSSYWESTVVNLRDCSLFKSQLAILMLSTSLGWVAWSMVSANHWLKGIKTYRLLWYLTRVSANHASSNWALVFPSPQKLTFPNSNLIWNLRAKGLSVVTDC